MKPRYYLTTALILLGAGAAQAQVMSATYNEPYCREFNKIVTVGGQPQPAYGQACYQPDGSWQIVSDQIPAAQPIQYYPQQHQVAYVPVAQPSSFFSLSVSSMNNPYRTRYYNDYGHGWRDNPWRNDNRGRHRGWQREDRHHHRHGGEHRGHDRH